MGELTERKFMFGKEYFKKNTVIFLVLIVVYALGNSMISSYLQVQFEENIANSYGAMAICKYVMAALPVLLMFKWGYVKKVKISQVLLGFALGALTFLFFMPNLLVLTLVNDSFFNVNVKGVIAVVVAAMGIGLIEETAIRGVLLPFLCEKWKDKKHPYVKAAIASSVVFGCLHLSWSVKYLITYKTLPMEYFMNNMYQVCYTFCFGIFMSAIVIKTKNLWGVIFWHGICDAAAFLKNVVVDPIVYRYIMTFEWLTFSNYLEVNGILEGVEHADQLIEAVIDIVLMVVGFVIIVKEEKKLEASHGNV